MKFAFIGNAVIDGVDRPAGQHAAQPEILSITGDDDDERYAPKSLVAKDYSTRHRELAESFRASLPRKRRELQEAMERFSRSNREVSEAFDRYYKRKAAAASRKRHTVEPVRRAPSPRGPPAAYCWDDTKSTTENHEARRAHERAETERCRFEWDPGKTNEENREARRQLDQWLERAHISIRPH